MSVDSGVRVDHVGIAVESVADAEPLLELLGAEKLVEEESETGTFVWAYYRLGDASRVELIEPVDGTESFLTEFLDRHGPGLHHVTLEVADIDAVVDALEAHDVRVVDRATFDGWTEAFVSPRDASGVLFQLMEYDDRFADRYDAGLFVGGERLSE
ncbi:VOC family protein [Halobacteriaceae archaeon GCM10025711]